MKKLITISSLVAIVAIIASNFIGCKTSEMIQAKSGVQLWGENCLRCHNTPSPADFSDAQWEAIETHMQVRANLTNEEAKKIFEFLQSAN